MFDYIRGRYGDPVRAWQWHLSHGWYDKGGWLPPGLSLAYNGTGQPERVIGPRGHGNPRITLEIRGSGSAPDQFLADMIKRYVQVSGGGDVQVAFGNYY